MSPIKFLSLIGVTSVASAQFMTNTPVLPDSGYQVHGERPYPAKVTNVSAVTPPAPSDAKILFDGTNLDAWKGDWQIKDGLLVASPKNLETKETFGKVQLHLEYRIPKDREVEGQKGGNSGIFLAGKYEIQVQESHTNVTYPDGQAGAMYGQYPPLVNPCTPQGEWQSYDIIFEPAVIKDGKVEKPALVTLFINGVLAHHAKPFLGVSTFRKIPKYPEALPEKGPLMIQWHKDPVEFRNIWIRELEDYPVKK